MDHFINTARLKDLREWVGYQIQDHQKAMSEGVNTELNRGARYAFDIIGWRLDDLIRGAEKASQLGTVRDVREALGISGGKEEEPEGLTALSTKLLKDRLDELMQSAAECSVSDSLSKEERACYQAKEDAYEVALSLIEINEEWQKKLAEAGKKA